MAEARGLFFNMEVTELVITTHVTIRILLFAGCIDLVIVDVPFIAVVFNNTFISNQWFLISFYWWKTDSLIPNAFSLLHLASHVLSKFLNLSLLSSKSLLIHLLNNFHLIWGFYSINFNQLSDFLSFFFNFSFSWEFKLFFCNLLSFSLKNSVNTVLLLLFFSIFKIKLPLFFPFRKNQLLLHKCLESHFLVDGIHDRLLLLLHGVSTIIFNFPKSSSFNFFILALHCAHLNFVFNDSAHIIEDMDLVSLMAMVFEEVDLFDPFITDIASAIMSISTHGTEGDSSFVVVSQDKAGVFIIWVSLDGMLIKASKSNSKDNGVIVVGFINR